jgi:hypothetical protein
MLRLRWLSTGALCALLVVWAGVASATTMTAPDLSLTVANGVGGSSMSGGQLNPVMTDPNGQLWNYSGSGSYYSPGPNSVPIMYFDWDIDVVVDPVVTGTINLTNLTSVTQTFVLSVTLPISPVPGPRFMSGSASGQVAADSATPLATLSTDGTNPFYSAFVWFGPNPGDKVLARTLLNHPSSVSTTFPNIGTLGPQVFANEPLAAAANNFIGLELHFTLTPGDTATAIGQFQVVPEPSSFLLGAFGLTALVGLRRRSGWR